ncbi:glutactin isoform X1 [Drosophila pseudoobscura]|uniref:Carboxylic ester hydrolase n=1 Tax=Drosophila pseudoobscura pseudoobscura TaxID=46245 RepID=A0A6I8UBP8_DROPS|nr:glutactin isoform X1 [Drosophila pseudoobscura]
MRSRGVYVMLTFCGLVSAALAAWLLVSLVGAQVGAEESTAVVTVELANGQGKVLGNFDVTAFTDQRFMQFRGIPFAESPAGDLRFRPPVPRSSWSPHTASALHFAQRCPVITHMDGQTSDAKTEDCLNVSVYTKNLTAGQPVMFYIYGGGYYNGSAEDHPPHYLLEKDVVLVVPQYRVGALGWLSTFTEDMPGNAPIADILLALQWVQTHISLFGGDPQQVTIFGQSAGSGVASALLLSPRTEEHLFKRAIVQSGSIFARWAINSDPRAQATRICEKLLCSGCEQEDRLWVCLRNASVASILRATQAESFSPVVGDLLGILPQHPSELVKTYQRQIPLLTGFTEHDGSFILASYYDMIAAKLPNVSALTVREFSAGLMGMANDRTGLTDNLLYRLLFTPELLNSHDHKGALPAYFDLTSAYMKSPVIALATKLYAQQPSAPVYVYSFEYEGKYTRFGYEFGNDHYPFNGGVHHSNENLYLFATHPLVGQDSRMSQKMVELWTSFAIDGRPKELRPLSSPSGPYNRLALNITTGEDLLETLTSAIDDPDNGRLQRENVDF